MQGNVRSITMIAKFSLLLLVCAVAASGNPAAGKPWHWKSPRPLVDARGLAPATGRIVGGVQAMPHEWPHQVALFVNRLDFCSGSLISNEWVLTAAHCMVGAHSVEVVMGVHNILIFEPSQISMTSTDFSIHENYDPNTIKNDIAVIKLPSPVTFNKYIQPVDIPSSDVSAGTFVTPTGWGKDSDNAADDITDVLRQVDVPVLSNDDCNAVYGIITDGNICIDSTGGKGICNGDSGGPLNRNGKTYGITSFFASEGCEAGYPGVFTRVTHYLDWIREKTGVTP